jgi:hypothetical protein
MKKLVVLYRCRENPCKWGLSRWGPPRRDTFRVEKIRSVSWM